MNQRIKSLFLANHKHCPFLFNVIEVFVCLIYQTFGMIFWTGDQPTARLMLAQCSSGQPK